MMRRQMLITGIALLLGLIYLPAADAYVTSSCHETEDLCHKYVQAGQNNMFPLAMSCEIPGHNAGAKKKQQSACPPPCTLVSVPSQAGNICGSFHVCWCPLAKVSTPPSKAVHKPHKREGKEGMMSDKKEKKEERK